MLIGGRQWDEDKRVLVASRQEKESKIGIDRKQTVG